MQFRRLLARKSTFRFIIFGVGILIGMFLGIVALFFAGISVNSKDMLSSVIQAEATIFGFFGIVASYILVSYDTRMDRLEQQRFDCELSNKDEMANSCRKKIASIKGVKKELTRVLGLVGSCLMLSLLFSVLALGAVDTNSAFSDIISYYGLGFLFTGVVLLVAVFITAGSME